MLTAVEKLFILHEKWKLENLYRVLKKLESGLIYRVFTLYHHASGLLSFSLS